MNFQRETVKDCIQEMMPLLEKHYVEIAHYKDIPLNVDVEKYIKFEESGLIRLFTLRTGTENKLVGYAAFIVNTNAHYKDSLQAVQDVIFIDPEYRGNGGAFFDQCDEALKLEGVQAVYHHVKVAHNFGPMLAKRGYELVDLIYAKRLDATR